MEKDPFLFPARVIIILGSDIKDLLTLRPVLERTSSKRRDEDEPQQKGLYFPSKERCLFFVFLKSPSALSRRRLAFLNSFHLNTNSP